MIARSCIRLTRVVYVHLIERASLQTDSLGDSFSGRRRELGCMYTRESSEKCTPRELEDAAQERDDSCKCCKQVCVSGVKEIVFLSLAFPVIYNRYLYNRKLTAGRRTICIYICMCVARKNKQPGCGDTEKSRTSNAAGAAAAAARQFVLREGSCRSSNTTS